MVRDIVQQKMIAAMKNKNKKDKDIYAYLLDQIRKADMNRKTTKNPNPPAFTNEEEQAVVKAVVKQIRSGIDKTLETANEKGINKDELTNFIAEREYEIKLYSEFLPDELSEEQIIAVIKEIGAELGENINRGVLMKQLMPRVKKMGSVDGKLVASLADKFIKGEL